MNSEKLPHAISFDQWSADTALLRVEFLPHHIFYNLAVTGSEVFIQGVEYPPYPRFKAPHAEQQLMLDAIEVFKTARQRSGKFTELLLSCRDGIVFFSASLLALLIFYAILQHFDPPPTDAPAPPPSFQPVAI